MISKMKVTMILKGRSFFKIVLSVLNEAKKAQIPTTIKPLKILEPIILLKAISLFPVNAARILTDASGALVPIATIVKPMITLGTFRNLARLQLPSTNKSAPLIRKIKPIINKIYSMFSSFLRKKSTKKTFFASKKLIDKSLVIYS